MSNNEEERDSLGLLSQTSNASIAWANVANAYNQLASIHAQYAKGKDAVFTTRQADYKRKSKEAEARRDACIKEALKAAFTSSIKATVNTPPGHPRDTVNTETISMAFYVPSTFLKK